jgi:cytochrome b561
MLHQRVEYGSIGNLGAWSLDFYRMGYVSRYHPLLVTLHWLLAVLIVGMLGVGFFWLAKLPNADPGKLDVLELHMIIGMSILALMALRLVVRLVTARPARASVGSPALDRLAPLTHYGFYVVVLLMVTSGYATAILAGLNRSVFGRSGEPLPSRFDIYPSFLAHRTLALLLAALIVLHTLAAFYHHFIRRDGLLRRMALGRRT